ncbi:MAG: hypothetical protein HKN49_02575 [Gammaproteobacteria bacterium]|nr:hypothetical protein [Gammaproteobacteria bacterium]
MRTTTLRGLCAALLLILASPSWGIVLTLEPAAQVSATGGTVFLDLTVSGLAAGAAPSLGAYDIDLGYDSGVLTLMDIVFGTGLNDPLDPDTPLFQSASAVPGSINLAEVSLLVDAVGDPAPLDAWQPGSFVIATLEFFVDILEPGSSTMVTIDDFLLGDGFGDAFVDVSSDNALIYNPSGVPEPMTGTLFLLGIGLIALARRLR